jgi:hypothetical protein
MSVTTAKPGDVLYFYPEEIPVLVVKSDDDGITYITPMNPKFDNLGNLRTSFISYELLGKWTISLGSVTNISATLIGKRS